MSRNLNCLEGMACPQCGHEDAFWIENRCLVFTTDDGFGPDDIGAPEHEPSARTTCPACGHEGTVAEFQRRLDPATIYAVEGMDLLTGNHFIGDIYLVQNDRLLARASDPTPHLTLLEQYALAAGAPYRVVELDASQWLDARSFDMLGGAALAEELRAWAAALGEQPPVLGEPNLVDPTVLAIRYWLRFVHAPRQARGREIPVAPHAGALPANV